MPSKPNVQQSTNDEVTKAWSLGLGHLLDIGTWTLVIPVFRPITLQLAAFNCILIAELRSRMSALNRQELLSLARV